MQNKINYTIKNPSIVRGVFCFSLIFISISIFSQPQLKFIDVKKNFGIVKKGEIVVLDFEFTNTGNEPLIIDEANVSCSCTSIIYSDQPVLPNQSSKIQVKFDTKSAYGRQDRNVEIISNAKNALQKIKFKGVVLK